MLHELGDGHILLADRAYDSDALRTACTENLFWRPPLGNRSIKADTGSRSRPTGGIEASIDALTSAGERFTPAQLGDAVLTTKADQHDPDLLFSGILLAGAAADIPNRLLRPGLQGV